MLATRLCVGAWKLTHVRPSSGFQRLFRCASDCILLWKMLPAGCVSGPKHGRCGHMVLSAGKLTGLDKQLSKSLDVEVQNDTSTAELATSPVGPLSEPSR